MDHACSDQLFTHTCAYLLIQAFNEMIQQNSRNLVLLKLTGQNIVMDYQVSSFCLSLPFHCSAVGNLFVLMIAC